MAIAERRQPAHSEVASLQTGGERICPDCKKPIVLGARFSVTSWIFRGNRCLCQRRKFHLIATEQGYTRKSQSAQDCERYLDLVGDFPGYRFIEQIGSGGMGFVFKVENVELGKVFAQKVLRREFAQDTEARARFERESDLAKELDHPGMVPIYERGTTAAGLPYLLLEYIDGDSLEKVINMNTCIEPERATSIFLQIVEAVDYAHQRGILHRDLKPSNVLITLDEFGNEVVKVVDFGIAKVLPRVSRETLNLTKTGDLFGSPYYMSPEQCMGETLDTKSDLYSIGCLMYETLTGSPPFVADNPVKTIMLHLTARPRPCGAVSVGYAIPAQLERLVMQCLEKNPSKRPDSAMALERELQKVQESFSGGRKRLNASVAYLYRRRLYMLLAFLPLVVIFGLAIFSYLAHMLTGSYILSGPWFRVIPLIPLALIPVWFVTCCASQLFWIRKANRIIETTKPVDMEVSLTRRLGNHRVTFQWTDERGSTRDISLDLNFRNASVPTKIRHYFDGSQRTVKAYLDEAGLPVALIRVAISVLPATDRQASLVDSP